MKASRNVEQDIELHEEKKSYQIGEYGRRRWKKVHLDKDSINGILTLYGCRAFNERNIAFRCPKHIKPVNSCHIFECED